MATPTSICSLLASCFGKCCKKEDEGKSNSIKTTFMFCVSAETIQLDAKDGSDEEEEKEMECAAKVEANLSSTRKRGSLHKEQETST